MAGTALRSPRSRAFARSVTLSLLLCTSGTWLAGCFGDDDDAEPRNPVPVLSSISPTSATSGGAAFTLTANGSGFVSGSIVRWNGSARPTTFVGATQVTAAIPASDLASAGTVEVTVVNPSPGGGTSGTATFTVENAVPAITSLDPASAGAGAAGFDLRVNGTGFVAGSVVQWNGAARTTTFVGSTALRVAVTAADVAAVGTAQVRVVNPPPGGGPSAAATFTIARNAPTITALSPAGVRAGSAAITLTVTGSGFLDGATVEWNGAARTTTVTGPTQVTARIPATDLATPGLATVRVANPPPSGGESNALQFVVSVVPGPVASPQRVTIGFDGSSSPDARSVNGGMDWEGRYVVFASRASNLVAGDTNGAFDVFVRDTCIGAASACAPTTRRLTVAADGSQANGDSGSTATSTGNALAVSPNGRYVVFASTASNLVTADTNGVDDVFLMDTCTAAVGACTPRTVLVSVRSDGTQTTRPSGQPAVGDDGRYVMFVSADVALVPDDGNGLADVFVRDTCLGAGAGCTSTTTRLSVAANGTDANGASGAPVTTGRYVAFVSTASNLVMSDTNGVADVFLRDTCRGAPLGCTPSTELASVGATGAQANGASFEPVVGPGAADFYGHEFDGRFVAFASIASNLVAGDTNNADDVFVRDFCRGQAGCTRTTVRASVTSAGTQIAGPSRSPGFLRWDGEVVAFVSSADGVVAGDTNGFADVFARGICWSTGPCDATTTRLSIGPNGVQPNGASGEPRMNHDPWGVYVATFTTDATNLESGGVAPPFFGNIYRAE